MDLANLVQLDNTMKMEDKMELFHVLYVLQDFIVQKALEITQEPKKFLVLLAHMLFLPIPVMKVFITVGFALRVDTVRKHLL